MKASAGMLIGAFLVALAGCSLPVADSGPAPQQYLLTADFGEARAAPSDAPVLMVARPRASAGFESAQMVYLEEPAALDAFARNRWAAPPAAMIEPMLVDALEATGAFRAVVDGGSGFRAGYRLDTEVLRLQQEFQERPSRVRFGLRAILVETASGEVVFARSFETTETAPGNDPGSGVAAASEAVKRLLGRVAGAVAEAVE